MKILITGSRGVVGTKLETELIARGHSVFGVDLYHCPKVYGHDLGKVQGENYYRCDISEYRQLEAIIKHVKPDLVYNCAAEFGRWNGEHFYEQVWKTNAIGTKNVLVLQSEYGFKLVHTSSSEVYGDFDGVMWESVLDTTSINQLNDYAISKRVNEMQIANHRKQFGNQIVAVRLFNTYGPGEWYHPFRSVNCVFTYNLLMERPITVYQGHTRTSTYIDDCVHALANISDKFIDGEMYNIASTQHHTIEELAKRILYHTGADPGLVNWVNKSEPMTTKDKIVDAEKAKQVLGMKESVTLDEGINKTVEWMKAFYVA